MAMRCGNEQQTTAHHAGDVSIHMSLKSGHKSGGERGTCCKATCVGCSALVVPLDFAVFLGQSSPSFEARADFLADLTLPPLLGPPRSKTSTL
jgi:hypothetical protein